MFVFFINGERSCRSGKLSKGVVSTRSKALIYRLKALRTSNVHQAHVRCTSRLVLF